MNALTLSLSLCKFKIFKNCRKFDFEIILRKKNSLHFMRSFWLALYDVIKLGQAKMKNSQFETFYMN